MLCNGDTTESCGGSSSLELYQDKLAITPIAPPYSYLGCYSDSYAHRVLNAVPVLTSTTMDLETCATHCQGYTYFGTENGM